MEKFTTVFENNKVKIEAKLEEWRQLRHILFGMDAQDSGQLYTYSATIQKPDKVTGYSVKANIIGVTDTDSPLNIYAAFITEIWAKPYQYGGILEDDLVETHILIDYSVVKLIKEEVLPNVKMVAPGLRLNRLKEWGLRKKDLPFLENLVERWEDLVKNGPRT